jgi:hypothetical protein
MAVSPLPHTDGEPGIQQQPCHPEIRRQLKHKPNSLLVAELERAISGIIKKGASQDAPSADSSDHLMLMCLLQ